MIRICCITYKYLDDLVRQAIDKIDDPQIHLTIVEGLRGEILDGVRREISDGAEILLAGGANAKIAEKTFHVPILNYKISDFDYLTAIHKGYELGDKVAIVTYQTGISSKLKKYLDSQNLGVKNIIYEDSQGLEDKVNKSDLEVIIGAAHAVEIGQKYGKKTVSIYPGIQSIIDTIYDAKQMALEIQKIKEQNQYANTILRYTTNGVLLIDAHRKIIDSNSAAEEIFKLNKRTLKNKEISEIIENWCDETFIHENKKGKNFIIQVNNQELLEKVIKIGSDPLKFEGAVVIFLKLNEVKKAQLEYEKKQREIRKQRGFEAKNFFSDIIGTSYPIKACINDAKVFAKSDASVLIYGETGVGKELFAQGIHNDSLRVDGPFIAINCGALTESLLEAELFGYDEGAFTGSRRGGKKGLFELAEGGTIFLDEIGEISPTMQTKLLRVLQEHEIMHVGGERIISINVRVIAATNKNLEHLPNELFRRDLLYRLNVLELHIPPLREREQDATLLFDYFFRQRIKARFSNITMPEAVKELISLHSWPGNIREMQNISERFCLYLEQAVKVNSDVLTKYAIKALGEDKILQSILIKHQYDEKNISIDLIVELKNRLSYNREQIARILGTSRTTIWRILQNGEKEG